MKALKGWLITILSVAVLVAALYIASAAVNNDLILPSPSAISAEFLRLLGQSSFYSELVADLGRTVASFLIAFVFALALGVAASMNVVVEKVLYPLTVIMRAMPAMAVILWCLLIFRAEISPSAISFIVVFPLLYTAVFGAVKNRDKKLDDVAKVYEIKAISRLFMIVIPDVWRSLFPQFCSALSFNVKLIVAGEALAYTKNSLGRELKIANANLETARLLALTVAIILLSVALEYALKGVSALVKRSVYGYNRKKIIEELR